jgi:hypothetical protein
MQTNIQKYFTWGIIVILVIIILLQRSCSSNVINTKSVTKIDTVFIKRTDTVVKTIPIYKTLPGKITKEYIPSSNCDSLKLQYTSIRDKFLSRNVYKDTLDISHFGNIIIIDTIEKNQLSKRTKLFNYKIPEITKTITNTVPPTRQLYIGGNIYGQLNRISIITPGLIYKDRQDRIYQANIGVNFDGSIVYGIGFYYKIKIK